MPEGVTGQGPFQTGKKSNWRTLQSACAGQAHAQLLVAGAGKRRVFRAGTLHQDKTGKEQRE
jgi:hypothetical protein